MVDISGINRIQETKAKVVSLLLGMPTNSPHHLSVGGTAVGGSVTLNVYLYLAI